MFAVTIDEQGRVFSLYDTDVYVDEGVDLHEITEKEKNEIAASGRNCDFVLIDGRVVYAPMPDIGPTADRNKAEAERRLTATDWVNQPDVYDAARTPHLTNRDAFLDYRSAVRAIAVNPVEGNLDWPVEPVPVWYS